VREGALHIDLDVLPQADAVQLLRQAIGPRARAEPGAVVALANLCGLHPLALRVAAERIAQARDMTVGDAVGQLMNAADRLSMLEIPDDEPSVLGTIFMWSYQALAPASRRLFRLLSLHDGPDIGLPACSSLAGMAQAQCRGVLANLVDAHLVDEPSPGRYQVHDLLRLFAGEQLASDEDEAGCCAAILRVGMWYLHSACSARRVIDPHLPPLAASACELPVPAMTFGSEDEALRWCDQERANLTAVTLAAARAGLHEIGWKLPTALFPYFDRRKHYSDWIATHTAAIVAANLAGEREAEGKVRCNLGSAYRPMRRLAEAVTQYELALDIFREVGWRQGQAKTLGNLGSCHLEDGDPAQGIIVGKAAMKLFRELEDDYGEALCKANIGNAYVALGSYAEAAAMQLEALASFRRLKDRRGAARAKSGLGVTFCRLGNPEDGRRLLTEAAQEFAELRDEHEQACVLLDLSEAYTALNQRDAATISAERAAEIFAALGEPWMVGRRQGP
jgi:tetratricopeptide (TPR) repeat protein